MHVTFCALALSGAVAGANFTTGVNWQTDYSQARSAAATADKPMAVFLAPGKDVAKVVTGDLNDAARERLESEYVCVVIDTETPTGQRLAAKFDFESDTGLVFSNRGGDLQAFAHDGTLNGSQLSFRVNRYAEDRAVVRTEQLTSPTSAPVVTRPAPTFIPSPVWNSAGYCPSCQR